MTARSNARWGTGAARPDRTAPVTAKGREPLVELLWFAGIIILWVALQRWVLPRFGVPT